jgi:hypothetical protein
MNQLLQGFQAIFDKQEEYRHDDYIDRQRFEMNIQDMVAARSHHSITYVDSVRRQVTTSHQDNTMPCDLVRLISKHSSPPCSLKPFDQHRSHTIIHRMTVSNTILNLHFVLSSPRHHIAPSSKKISRSQYRLSLIRLHLWNSSLMVSRVI